MTELELERRVEKLEDVKSIERMMAAYGRCVDDGYNLAGLEELLTEDLVWKSNAFGEYSGRDSYLRGQNEISKGVEWAFHAMVPIDVSLTGRDVATGIFYLLMLATFLDTEGGRQPIVLSARYDNSFRREGEAWRCSRMNVTFHQVSRLTEGWVLERFWQS